MTSLQIAVLPTAEAVSRAVASHMAAAMLPVLASQQIAHICITGGRGGHGALAALAQDPGIDWGQVHVWWSDERFVPRDDPQRNAVGAQQALFDHVDLPVSNIHPMPDSDMFSDLDEAAQAYAEELAAFGDPGPRFRVSILGVGEDGHVASLFPEHPGLRETRSAFPVRNSPKPPPDRITMSFPMINTAETVILIASGDGKADAVGLLVNDPGPLAVPAAGVHGTAQTLLAIDRAAAAHLPPGLTRYL